MFASARTRLRSATMTPLRVAVLILLAWGAYWSALPWIDCLRAYPFGLDLNQAQFCTLGTPVFRSPGPGSPPAHLANLLVALAYVFTAVLTAVRGRPI